MGVFNRSERILEAYRDGLKYGCAEFKDRVYIAHRRIEEGMGEGMQMEGERKGKNLGMPRNGRRGDRMGKGIWSCIKAGKYKVPSHHRRSLVLSNPHRCLVISTKMG